MSSQSDSNVSLKLPIRGDLRWAYVSSLTVATLMTAASLLGLLYPNQIYPSDENLQTFIPNDVINLVIGLPILLASMWFTLRGNLIGLLLLPGALFYVVYIYLIYLFSLPAVSVYPIYLVIVTISLYSIVVLLCRINGDAVMQRLSGYVPEKLAGGILAGLASAFMLRVMGVFADATFNGNELTTIEQALLVTDFLFSPAWILGGVMLWQRRILGYITGLGLLFQASMMFIGLVVFMLMQPVLTDAPISVPDILTTLLLSLIAVIPLILFIRGVVSDRD